MADLAEATGMVIQEREDGYGLTTPGGANQIDGDAQGRIGDMPITGEWRFQVISMEPGQIVVTARAIM